VTREIRSGNRFIRIVVGEGINKYGKFSVRTSQMKLNQAGEIDPDNAHP
jgi:hypothetical protein